MGISSSNFLGFYQCNRERPLSVLNGDTLCKDDKFIIEVSGAFSFK